MGTILFRTQSFSKSKLGSNRGPFGRGYDTACKMRKAELPFVTRWGKKSCIKTLSVNIREEVMSNSCYHCSGVTFFKGCKVCFCFLVISLKSTIKNKNNLARSKNPRCYYCKKHRQVIKEYPNEFKYRLEVKWEQERNTLQFYC